MNCNYLVELNNSSNQGRTYNSGIIFNSITLHNDKIIVAQLAALYNYYLIMASPFYNAKTAIFDYKFRDWWLINNNWR